MIDLEQRPARRFRRDPKDVPEAPGTTTTSIAPSGGGPASFAESRAAGGAGASNLPDRLGAFRLSLQQGIEPDLGTVLDARLMERPGGLRHPSDGPAPRKSVTQLLEDARRWDRRDIEAMQQRLYESGYYEGLLGQGAEVPWGKYDEATRRAYSNLIRDAILTPDKSLQTLLDEGQESYGPILAERSAGGGIKHRAGQVGGGNVYQTTISDTDQLHRVASEAAVRLLGRGLTEADKAEIASVIQRTQRDEDAKVNAAQEDAGRKRFGAGLNAADAAGAAAAAGEGGSTSTPDFDGFVNRLIAKESGGSPTAIGQPTQYGTATGKYQILDSTWGNHGGYRRAADAPESVQDEFARKKLKGYYDQFGAEGAAVAWYAGPGAAAQYVKNPADPKWDRPQMAGGKPFPSIRSYATSVAGAGSAVAPAGGYGGPASPDVYIAPTSVTTQQVNPEAKAEELIQQKYGTEVQAHSVANVYTRMRRLMGATSGAAPAGSGGR